MAPAPMPPPVKLVRKRLAADEAIPHLLAVAAGARALELRTKALATARSDASADGLAALGRRLLDGELAGLQLRFLTDDGWWCDTVMRTARGFRLARMKEEAPPA